MSKWKCPKTKIRSSIGNSSKDKLNGFNKLVNENVSKGSTMIGICCWFILLQVFNFIVCNGTSFFLCSPIIFLLILIVLNLLNQIFSLFLIAFQKSLVLSWLLFLHWNVVQGLVFLSVELVHFVKVVRFREKHSRYTDHCDNQEENTEPLLETIWTNNTNSSFINWATAESHVDHISDDWWCKMLSSTEVC